MIHFQHPAILLPLFFEIAKSMLVILIIVHVSQSTFDKNKDEISKTLTKGEEMIKRDKQIRKMFAIAIFVFVVLSPIVFLVGYARFAGEHLGRPTNRHKQVAKFLPLFWLICTADWVIFIILIYNLAKDHKDATERVKMFAVVSLCFRAVWLITHVWVPHKLT